MNQWHKVPGIQPDLLPAGIPVQVIVDERIVGLLRNGGGVSAFSGKCPHAGALLCEGWLDGRGRIVCPLHKYAFDPANGRNTTGEGYKLVVYPVELREDGIYIGLLPRLL
jgi:nitrite reductase/ring-hydroxylating ferredoxin subunit